MLFLLNVLSGEATNTNFISFGVTQQELEPKSTLSGAATYTNVILFWFDSTGA
jgi:hypothetical protein